MKYFIVSSRQLDDLQYDSENEESREACEQVEIPDFLVEVFLEAIEKHENLYTQAVKAAQAVREKSR